MIALPMHPSYAYPIRELKANAKEILQAAEDQANKQLGGKVHMDLVGKICPMAASTWSRRRRRLFRRHL